MVASPTAEFDKCCVVSVVCFLVGSSTVHHALHHSITADICHHASSEPSGSCSKAAHSQPCPSCSSSSVLLAASLTLLYENPHDYHKALSDLTVHGRHAEINNSAISSWQPKK